MNLPSSNTEIRPLTPRERGVNLAAGIAIRRSCLRWFWRRAKAARHTVFPCPSMKSMSVHSAHA